MKYLMALALISMLQVAKAQKIINQEVNYFVVKENLLKNDELAIIATDSLENPQKNINGVFNFSVNGFRQELNFHDGVAVCPLQIDKSTFVFVKHLNDDGSHSKLYFVYKSGNSLKPFAVNGYLLLAIPLLLVLIGYLFRKLIGLMIFILLVLFYFYYSKGLSIPTFSESAIDGVKSLF